MIMRPHFLLLFFFHLLLAISSHSQEYFREFAVSDSTEYNISSDSNLVAGRTRLYLKTNTGTQLLYHFNSSDPRLFIRDANIVAPDLWYVIIGSRYIGHDSQLLRSTDQGTSWTEDTSFYSTTLPAQSLGLIANYRSLNQMHQISADTLALFVAYYSSGIIYSTDRGTSWQLWFGNTPAHYPGLFSCGQKYYLYGIEGDGFSASMFSFSKELLFSPDTNAAWTHGAGGYHPGCFNGGTPGCIYAPNGSRTGQFNHFKHYIDSVCGNLNPLSDIHGNTTDVLAFPNPNDGILTVVSSKNGSSLTIFSRDGCLLEKRNLKEGNNHIDIQTLGSGLYFYSISSGLLEPKKGKIIVR